MVSCDNYLLTYCAKCFSKINEIKVSLSEQMPSSVKILSKLKYHKEILTIVMSKDEKYLGVMIGVNQIKELEDLQEILIYRITDKKKNILIQILSYNLPEKFSRYSKTFFFDQRKNRNNDNGLLLLSRFDVVLFDFNNPTQPVTSVIYTYCNPLND